MGKFAATEAQGDFHLVAFADELVDRLHLHVIVVIVDVRTHLDLFDLLRLLALAGDVRLFLGLVLEFADIEELAHRRIGAWRHLDKVEPALGRGLDRLPSSEEPTSELTSPMSITSALFLM